MPTKTEVQDLVNTDAKHGSAIAKQKAKAFDDTRTWVDPKGHRLSDRVWQSGQSTRTQIDDVLRNAVKTREDALVTAKKLEQFLSPEYSLTRGPSGKILKGQSGMLVTRTPGRGGQGSYAARRLARSEVSRAHAQETSRIAKQTPFAVGESWNLSAAHPKPDECNDFSEADNGLGPGVYRVGFMPRMPAHPHCLCFTAIVTVKDDKEIVQALRNQYGLGSDASMSVPANFDLALPSDEQRRLARNESSRLSKQRARERALGRPPTPSPRLPEPPPVTRLPEPPPVTRLPEPPISGSGFQPVSTTAEARERLAAMRVDLGRVDVDMSTVNHILADFEDLQRAKVIGTERFTLNILDTVPSANEGAFAWFRMDGLERSMNINASPRLSKLWSGVDDKLVKQSQSSGFITGGSTKDLIAHEFAHIRYAEKTSRLTKEAFEALDPALIRREISKYAATDPDEFIAEAYTHMLRTGKRLSPKLDDTYRTMGGPRVTDDMMQAYNQQCVTQAVTKLPEPPPITRLPEPPPTPRPPTISIEEQKRLARNESSRLSKRRARERALGLPETPTPITRLPEPPPITRLPEPIPSTGFTPVTTVKEAQEYAKTLDVTLGKYATNSPVNTFQANEVNAALKQLVDQGVDIRGVTFEFVDDGSGAYARAFYDRNTILVNTSQDIWKNKVMSDISGQGARGWLFDATPQGIIRHEVGHLEHLKSASEEVFRNARNPVAISEQQLIRRELGEYATKNYREVVAEMYSGLTDGKTFSDELMAIYNKWQGPKVGAAKHTLSQAELIKARVLRRLAKEADEKLAREAAEQLAREAAEQLAREAQLLAWKPRMTFAEADEWAKNSAYHEPLFHGTTLEGAIGIIKEGFDLGRSKWGRVWGNGVYSTPHRKLAREYAGRNGEVLELRIKTLKPLRITVDPDDGFDTETMLLNAFSGAEEVRARALWKASEQTIKDEVARLRDLARYNPDQVQRRAFQAQADKLDSFGNNEVHINAVLDGLGYDALVITSRNPIDIDQVGGSQVIVRSIQQVVVVD